MRGFHPSLIRFLIAAALTLPAAHATAEVVYPKGSRVGIDAPATMTLNPAGPRFEDAERKSAITILDLPALAFTEFQTKMFEATNAPGLVVEKREPFATGSGLGYLMTLRLEEAGQKSRKWVFLGSSNTPDINNLTTLVSVDVPESELGFYTEEKVRAALATVTFRNVPAEEQLSLLPYKLSDLAGFRVVQTMPPAGVVLTEGPADRSMTQPGMIIAILPQQPPEAEARESLGIEMLRSFGLADLKITSSETLRLKGQPMYEVRGEAKDPQGGGAVSVVQWIRFGENGFTRIVGICPSAQWAEIFPRFRAVRDGIAPKQE